MATQRMKAQNNKLILVTKNKMFQNNSCVHVHMCEKKSKYTCSITHTIDTILF